MYQNGAQCAFARGLLVLIDPATVIGEGAALEEILIVRSGLVHQHEQHFSFDVDIFVIVPVVLGRFNAIAHENDWSIDIGFRLLGFVVSDILFERLKLFAFAAAYHGKSGLRKRRDTHQRNTLHEGAVVSGRFQAFQRKLSGDVLGSDIATTLAGAAAFQQVMRQKTDVSAQALSVNLLHGSNSAGGQMGRAEIRLLGSQVEG